jgi:hypothetical protein
MSTEQYSNYQMNTNTSIGAGNGPMMGGIPMTAPYGQAGFYPQGLPSGNPNAKKRPTTANRRNNIQFGANIKKSFGSKNPSTLDLDVSRMRPRFANQDKERLIEDAMK